MTTVGGHTHLYYMTYKKKVQKKHILEPLLIKTTHTYHT